MESSNVRRPAVAGQFYPATAQGIKKEIEGFIDKACAKQDVIACMLPHAGYAYSGKVAARTVSGVNIKERVVLLGPNHTGYGADFSIMTEGSWLTPLGQVKIDSILAKKLMQGARELKEDALAHQFEHSLEVELPFLQYFRPDFQIVPIAFMCDDLARLKKTGEEIGATLSDPAIRNSVMLVASSDMTHYESQEEASKKDNEAIKAILELDEDKLMHRIRALSISMCGFAPVIAMLAAAKKMGANKAKLIKYETSGEVTDDFDSVVGYAGIIVY